MATPEEEQFRTLKRKHHQLLREWRGKRGLCIICAASEGNEDDHLPPKVLLPKSLRDQNIEFLTYPVCARCNRISSDEDFLFSVLLSIGLNQESIRLDQEPSDPDLLALYRQAQCQLEDEAEAERRKALLRRYLGKDPRTGRDAIDILKLPLNHTTTKIVKSIYWLHTGGDVLEAHNPGWWIRPFIDTSKINLIEKHLKVSNADIQWEDRFIAHYTIGHPANGVGGLISCSLHFYTNRSTAKGMNWYLIAAPVDTLVNGVSLYEQCLPILGPATIEPQK